MKKILTCENLTASYDGVKVINSLSFSISEGDYLCILGENGSGKSTLVKCLLGIKPADGGKITLGDGLKHTDIGYLPQHTPMQSGFPATVSEVVLSGCLGRRGRQSGAVPEIGRGSKTEKFLKFPLLTFR